MTDHGIIFTAENAQKIWDGQKTMTRRIPKPKKGTTLQDLIDRGDRFTGGERSIISCTRDMIEEPKHQVGDRLWVREPFQFHAEFDHLPPRDLVHAAVLYIGSRPDMLWDARKRAAKHMPKWASRMTLLVTAVRVERLQFITEIEAEAEGAAPVLVPPDGGSCPHVEGFRDNWESIHGPGSWDENPWVTVIEFDTVRENIGEVV